MLAFDRMAPFELGSVVEVLGINRLGLEWYDLRVCAETPGPLRMAGGFTMTAPYGLDEFAQADTVIVPGVANVHDDEFPELIAALRQAQANGARVVSICSGAFALAAAGLLDGLGATTHWKYAPILARRFPKVRVEPDVLYVDNGSILTSAGSSAGIDLCLHLVRTDHGARVANSVARHLVAPPHRDGGQAQFVEAAVIETGADDPIGGPPAGRWTIWSSRSPCGSSPGRRSCRSGRSSATSPAGPARARCVGSSPSGCWPVCRCWSRRRHRWRRWARRWDSRARRRSGTTSAGR